ncbi:MAG: ABC transporter substrate-binding protein [Methylobacter sp.]|nr:ABC transporter substrate-binding protein [Methylobacter sp.]MDP2097081.1 ABC transporter substrate-binding protein [Methylobacter sp.]MDP2428019.1 ABC transporter substrate-binding protein [Methylobacter sp.]MDP3055915.1 ABC transporter substrate-binding protein [Methylobacter sp.]MDP3363073.1 ABC transporter substrate-binding protein [Methylobacter sp.]
MKAKQVALLGLWVVLLGLMSVTRVIAADLLPPQQPIHAASVTLQERLQDKTFTQDFAKIAKFVNEVIYPHTDFDRISALVLGTLWKTATNDERERFKNEFQTLLVRTYSRAFVEFKDWSVRFLPLEMEPGATKVVVRTEVLQPGIQPIAVNYRMLLSKGEWKAYDIMIEGVSLVTNYRTTFANEVQSKGSLSAVIEGLVKRNAEALAAKTAARS